MEKIPNQQERNSAWRSSFLDSNPKNPVQIPTVNMRGGIQFLSLFLQIWAEAICSWLGNRKENRFLPVSFWAWKHSFEQRRPWGRERYEGSSSLSWALHISVSDWGAETGQGHLSSTRTKNKMEIGRLSISETPPIWKTKTKTKPWKIWTVQVLF